MQSKGKEKTQSRTKYNKKERERESLKWFGRHTCIRAQIKTTANFLLKSSRGKNDIKKVNCFYPRKTMSRNKQANKRKREREEMDGVRKLKEGGCTHRT